MPCGNFILGSLGSMIYPKPGQAASNSHSYYHTVDIDRDNFGGGERTAPWME